MKTDIDELTPDSRISQMGMVGVNLSQAMNEYGIFYVKDLSEYSINELREIEWLGEATAYSLMESHGKIMRNDIMRRLKTDDQRTRI